MKKFLAISLVFVLIFAVACVGCGAKGLNGTWKQVVNGVEVYGFTFTDSTVAMSVAGGEPATFDCTKVDDHTLKVTAAGVESTWTYELDGDSLKLTISEFGTPISLERQ